MVSGADLRRFVDRELKYNAELILLVEQRGIEPLASALRTRVSPFYKPVSTI
jgi:hypothetical protein